MENGFIKCAAVSPRIRVAEPAYNERQIAAGLEEAYVMQARLVVFPELCLTGYTCGDLFLQPVLLRAAREALCRLAKLTEQWELVAIIGVPLVHNGKLYNCAAVLGNGRILGVVPKTHLPNYNEFYEARQFTPAPGQNDKIHIGSDTCPFGANLLFRHAELEDFCFGVEICEDLWVPAPRSAQLAAAGAHIIANTSASNETIGKREYRRMLVESQSARLLCGYIYADAGEGESTTDMVFSGHCLLAENGITLAESEPFAGGITLSEIDVERLSNERRRMETYPSAETTGFEVIRFELPVRHVALTRRISPYPFVPEQSHDREKRCEEILSIQAYGLKKRVEHTYAKTLVVGVSGGLDSCLALLVAVRTMDLLSRPRGDIRAVTMPCFGTTERTRGNAERLCEALGVRLQQIDIAASVRQHFEDIGQSEETLDVTYENAQARERTQILMDIANMTGGLVVGTGDLSELALGWATYSGDHMSMYGVNASVPKTLIRHIVRYIADTSPSAELSQTLEDILDTPVSPELLPAENGDISQKTEDLVGPYELHDFFLYYALRWSFPPQKILRLALYAFGDQYDEETIRHWLRIFFKRFFSQQFKRSCLPDGPKVGSVSLSPRGDLRMPSDASSSLWLLNI